MRLISAGFLLIWCLSILDCVSGVAITTAECGSGATVGQPYVLTCTISGSIGSGISWFRGNDASSIITCSQGSNCLSNNPALYSVTTPHPTDKQQFTILSVSSDDVGQSWKCVDGSTLPSVSGCKLEEAETTTTTTVGNPSPGSAAGGLSGGGKLGIVIGVLVVVISGGV